MSNRRSSTSEIPLPTKHPRLELQQLGGRKASLPLSVTSIVHSLTGGSPVQVTSNEGLHISSPMHPSPARFPVPPIPQTPPQGLVEPPVVATPPCFPEAQPSVQVVMPGSTPGSITSTQYSIYSTPMSAALQSAMKALVSNVPVSLPPPPYPLGSSSDVKQDEPVCSSPSQFLYSPTSVRAAQSSSEKDMHGDLPSGHTKAQLVEWHCKRLEKLLMLHEKLLKERFFLENNGNMVDFASWKRRPNPMLDKYLKEQCLDPSKFSQPAIETKIDKRRKEFRNSLQSSTSDLNSPAFASPLSPVTVTDLVSPVTSPKPDTGTAVSQPSMPPSSLPIASSTTDASSESAITPVVSTTITINTPQTPLIFSTTASSTATTGLSTVPTVSTPLIVSADSPKFVASPQTRSQSFTNVLESSHEDIIMRARHEAEVMKAISELRKEGLWSASRLPKVQEPTRCKTHWDYLLEEMQWLATDFANERRWKKASSRKLARSVARRHQEQLLKSTRVEKEETLRLKKIASSIAKEIKHFWDSIQKIVEYKQQLMLEEKRKKALDMHLNYIVDQTEKYSSWLVKGFNDQTGAASQPVPGPASSSQEMPTSSSQERPASSSQERPASSSQESATTSDDQPFVPSGDSTDEEETIEMEEESAAKDGEQDYSSELAALQREGEMPIEDLLATLPEALLSENVSPLTPSSAEDDDEMEENNEESSEVNQQESQDDVEYVGDEDDQDEEGTISEQEQAEEDKDNDAEIQQLSKEGEIPIEELLAQYGVQLGSAASTPASTEAGSSDDEETSSGSDDDDDDDDGADEQDDHVEEGTSFLISGKSVVEACQTEQGLTDVAAAAEQLQPKGITLSTTKVQTPIPFLLKHKLREYQHIGLDWLMMMHDRMLNGILADEMGLGKTMQTIALLAHLACQKGNWGPHLIVVPTSVMLNWECEFKKWCPAFKILTYFGSHKERKQKRVGWTKPNTFHVCITSYNIVVQDHRAFKQKKWKYLVLDEAQNIKNFKSQRWQTLLNFNSQRRLLLTGTPLQNSLMELWSLMHFLMPTVFSSHSDFREWFSNPLTGMVEGSQEYSESIVRRLHQVLRPFLLRRLKMEVEKQMPKKYEHIIRCRLSKRQRFLYEEYMSRTRTKETLATGDFLSVINILMQLRKVCNHPDLFEPRPTVSPLCVEPLVYHTGSEVTKVLDYQPFKHVSFKYLNLCLADTECETDAFAVFRTRLLQAHRATIVDWSSIRGTVGLSASSSTTSCYEDLHMPSLETLQYEWHIGRLRHIADVNNRRCSRDVMYGQDLYQAVTMAELNEGTGKVYKNDVDYWLWCGYQACQLQDSQYSWDQSTQALSSLLLDNSQRATLLDDVLQRFLLVVPAVYTKPISMHISHPHPSTYRKQYTIQHTFSEHFSPSFTLLHPIATRRCFQFPETRLIQYDCGKLQTLDTLLRQLKQGGHRVLIFTQMARMLDVLEIFLNYHGHTYLRLDGATPVQKRQFLMDRFNRDERLFCFILSTRSGGLGVNLTGADTVVFYDSDWNPTMDAQAQDRCHRIGQTRDVHIYRLICDSTVEENILKKAHQKKMLGDIAIEGGGFTTEFFQQSSIRDLFTMDSSQEENEEETPVVTEPTPAASEPLSSPAQSPLPQKHIESLLSKAEDNDDVEAAKAARAEQVAERAEFDECFVPRVSTSEQAAEEESKTFIELESIESQLIGVEKFALHYLESQMADIAAEQLRQAERDIEQAKKGWELSHLQSLKEEEERLAEEEDSAIMLTYDRPEVANKVFVDSATGEEMPVWFPPTPPADSVVDYYTDFSLQMLYDTATVMPESALPPIADYVTDVDIFGLNRQQSEMRDGTKKTSTKSLHKRSKDRPQISETLFWQRPMVEMLSHKMRKIPAPTKKIKGTKLDQFTPLLDHITDHVDWTYNEDWLLLKGATHIMEMPINLTVSVPGQVPNWDILADLVTAAGTSIRSFSQCRDRYINTVMIREEAKSDDHQKFKTKDGSHKKSRLKSLRTKTQVIHDGGKAHTRHFSKVFDQITMASHKKTAHPRHITDGTHKASLHPQLLSDTFNIHFDTPMSPVLLASQKAERVQNEKSQQDMPKHTLHNLLNQGQSYSQVSQLPPGNLKPYQGGASGLPVGGGNFVGQPITSRRVTGATSIAAPIVTSITSLARSGSLSNSQLSYTKAASGTPATASGGGGGTPSGDPTAAQSIPRRQSVDDGSSVPQAVNPLPAHLAMPSVRSSIGGSINPTNASPIVTKAFPATSAITQSTHNLLQSRLSSQQQMLLLQHKMQQQQLLRSQSAVGKPITGQAKLGLPGAPNPGIPKAHSVAEDMVVALLKQQQQQQQAARVNSSSVPMNFAQQQASQLLKRPIVPHDDHSSLHAASQLFTAQQQQQQQQTSDPHEHTPTQQSTSSDSMETN